MKAQVKIFEDALAAMQRHATALQDDTASLRRTTHFPPALAAVYGVEAPPAPPVLLDLLEICAGSALRRAGQVEDALRQSKPSRAMALIVSAMTGSDRPLEEGWPLLDPTGFVSLYARLMPIYTQATPLFRLDAEPPDDALIDAFARWLATHPHPWDGRS